jgi:DNA-directed RNA polymerase beta subunit
MPIFKRQILKNAERKFFTSVRDAMPVPDLIDVQKSSYDWFLKFGIKDLFEEVSPMTDFSGRDLELYLENYYLDEPKFDEVVCRERNLTFEAPLRVTARLLNKRTGQSKSQEIYFGYISILASLTPLSLKLPFDLITLDHSALLDTTYLPMTPYPPPQLSALSLLASSK